MVASAGNRGGEGIDFKGGSRIDVMASSIESGHGKTIDLGHPRRGLRRRGRPPRAGHDPGDDDQALTRQLWVTSTAGWEASDLPQAQGGGGPRGRRLTVLTRGICYFEWSRGPMGFRLDDPATWYGCMPALGITIREAGGRATHLRRRWRPEEFERAFLNRWTTGEARVIPKEVWDAVSAEVSPEGGLCFGIDASPDRSWGSIAVVDSVRRCELVQHQEGVTWMVARVQELAKQHRAKVAVDVKGPAGSLIPELEAHGVALVKYGADEMAGATSRFYDAVADRECKVRFHPDLETAVAGARKRVSGERWYWSRTSPSVDISPLVALDPRL